MSTNERNYPTLLPIPCVLVSKRGGNTVKTIKLRDVSAVIGTTTIEAQLAAAERNIMPATRPAFPEALSMLPFVPSCRDRRTGQLLDPLNPSKPVRSRAAPLTDEAASPHPTRLVSQLGKLSN